MELILRLYSSNHKSGGVKCNLTAISPISPLSPGRQREKSRTSQLMIRGPERVMKMIKTDIERWHGFR